MRKVFFRAVPFVKEEVTLALEAGVSGLILPGEDMAAASSLARCEVADRAELAEIYLSSREDEAEAARLMRQGRMVVLGRGWEVIPVENLLAREEISGKAGRLALEVASPEEAALAAGILERGVEAVVVGRENLAALKGIVEGVNFSGLSLELSEAVVTEIIPVGMGHRVCVDTLSLLATGQGLLTGNSSAFAFLVNAETERNEYVASRPFRINAGAVHAYVLAPGDRAPYLEELRAGMEVLIADHKGRCSIAVAGRIKVERRPMLLVRARSGDLEGSIFLQNAETICLVRPGGAAVSVVRLLPGDTLLCRLDSAGRHFGMRITEEITEG
ncbi:MAG: 3-dehydroquinate synthase II family protein [Deltaproteobacteria bacterium]|jgi:3-dehydroquinate synthase II|nr:3-dehydroquinate synthase II family protein [Deltaproteobacteria bacterium]